MSSSPRRPRAARRFPGLAAAVLGLSSACLVAPVVGFVAPVGPQGTGTATQRVVVRPTTGAPTWTTRTHDRGGRAPLLTTCAAVDVAVRSFAGEAIGTRSIDLRRTRTGKDMYVVHRKYVKERRDARQGTASTKTRAEVSGGGRKPYKQKGTGRARRGSSRSPLIVGGGVAHGPKPKNWANKKMNRKEAELAIAVAIQNKLVTRNEGAVVVDSIVGQLQAPPKTKAVVALMQNLGLDVDRNTIMVVEAYDEVLDKSQNNLPKLELRLQDEISVSDMLWAEQLIFSESAFEWVKQHYASLDATDETPAEAA